MLLFNASADVVELAFSDGGVAFELVEALQLRRVMASLETINVVRGATEDAPQDRTRRRSSYAGYEGEVPFEGDDDDDDGYADDMLTLEWAYVDDFGVVQGPFAEVQMQDWTARALLRPTTLVQVCIREWRRRATPVLCCGCCGWMCVCVCVCVCGSRPRLCLRVRVCKSCSCVYGVSVSVQPTSRSCQTPLRESSTCSRT
jgi:hypothetical protein